MLVLVATGLPGWASDADKYDPQHSQRSSPAPPRLSTTFASCTWTPCGEVAPFMQLPPGRLAPCLLVEVSQNARALFWRQCGLFRISSSHHLAPTRGSDGM